MENDIPVERGSQAGNLFSGKLRVITPDEEAYMSGKTIDVQESQANRVGTKAGDPSERLVPDGKGGFVKMEEAACIKPAEVRVEPVQAARHKAASGEEGIIRINDEHRKVVIECKGKFPMCGSGEYGKETLFSVTVEAVSIDVSDDGVSLLIHGDISIDPPTLTDMTIKIGKTLFDVTYTGGKHRLGSYVNMSFARFKTHNEND